MKVAPCPLKIYNAFKCSGMEVLCLSMVPGAIHLKVHCLCGVLNNTGTMS